MMIMMMMMMSTILIITKLKLHNLYISHVARLMNTSSDLVVGQQCMRSQSFSSWVRFQYTFRTADSYTICNESLSIISLHRVSAVDCSRITQCKVLAVWPQNSKRFAFEMQTVRFSQKWFLHRQYVIGEINTKGERTHHRNNILAFLLCSRHQSIHAKWLR